MPRNHSRSLFAQCLTALLDETGRFTRKEWSSVLGVSESAISQWVTDKTVPRPDLLYMLYDVVKNSATAPPTILEAFDAMAQRPVSEVSPLGDRMGETVWSYMTRPAFADFAQRLRGLSLEEQQLALEGQIGPPRATLMVPTVHLNGTSKDELLRQIQDAATQLNVAIATLHDAAPHGRDYYVQGSDAYREAAREHESRIERLTSVYRELEELMEVVIDAK